MTPPTAATTLEGEDLLATVVEAIKASAVDARVDQETFNRLVAAHRLPARSYRAVQLAVAEAGLDVVDRLDDDYNSADEDKADETEGWDGDGFGVFLARTRHRVLTASEEVELAQRVEAGELARQALTRPAASLSEAGRRDLRRRLADGDEARNEFARHNLRLVIKLSAGFQGRGLPLDDLVQEGWFGLAHAIDKFDYRRGFKFSTYATWWIRQALQRAVDNLGSTIRIPVHAADELRRVKRFRWALKTELHRKPTTAELAAAAGLDEATVKNLLRYQSAPRSLDGLLSPDGFRLMDVLPDRSLPDPADEAERLDEAVWVRRLVSDLDPREGDILFLRYGLDAGGQPRTLEEVGALLGLTRERVRQIESKAIAHMKELAATPKRIP